MSKLTHSYKTYHRRFLLPMRSAHGDWSSERSGILLKVSDGRHSGYGEVAPLPRFGTETLEEAEQILATEELPSPADIQQRAPATAFAISCALEMLESRSQLPDFPPNVTVTRLLGSGVGSIEKLKRKNKLGVRSYKWKIGIQSTQLEQIIFEELADILRISGGTVRIDGNQSLSLEDFESWIPLWEKYKQQIDFIEEPTTPDVIFDLPDIGIPIALDESVSTVDKFREHAKTWKQLFVIKPAVSGNCEELREILTQVGNRTVVSGVFETGIGQYHALRLAAEAGTFDHAVGFGIDHYFEDDGLGLIGDAPLFDTTRMAAFNPVTIWNKAQKRS